MNLIRILAALSTLALAGCAAAMGDVRPFPAAVAPAPAPALATPAPTLATAGGGSIYQQSLHGGGGQMALFQDNKARAVGDLLTVVLVERTTSRATATTAIGKANSVEVGAPNIGGVPVTVGGRPLSARMEGTRAFTGNGASQQSNQLDGSLTVQVVELLGNGHLRVAGEKRLRLNQGDELVQVQGIVRLADIGPDNRIRSDRVGDAQIVYGGRGSLARSNAMGWLGRFFNSAAFPY